MDESGDVLVKIAGDISSLKAAFSDAQAVVKGQGASMQESLGALGVTMAKVFSVTAVIAFVGKAVTEYAKLEASLYKLGVQMERNGVSWKAHKAAVEDYLEAAEKTYLFEKADIAAALTNSIRLVKDYSTALGVTTLAMKLAKATGMDLASATNMIGLAAQGNERGINQLGRTLGLTAEQSKDVKLVFSELAKQTAATTETNDTLGRSFKTLGVQLGDMMEQIGGFFATPTKWILNLTNYVLPNLWAGFKHDGVVAIVALNEITNRIIYSFDTFVARIKMAGKSFIDSKQAAVDYQKALQKASDDYFGRQKSWLDWQAEKEKEIYGSRDKEAKAQEGRSAMDLANRAAAQAAATAAAEGMEKADEEAKAFQDELNLALTQEQIFQKAMESGTTNIGLLFTKMSKQHVQLRREDYNTLEEWKKASKQALEQVQKEAETKAKIIKQFAQSVADGFGSTFSQLVVKAHESSMTVEQIFKEMGRSIFRAIVDAVADILMQWGAYYLAKAVAEFIDEDYEAAARSGLAGAGLEVAGGAMKGTAAAYLAEGGMVDRATRAVIGEAGPEAVIPLNKKRMQEIGLGATTQQISINLPNVKNPADFSRSDSKATIARAMLSVSNEVKRRKGTQLGAV